MSDERLLRYVRDVLASASNPVGIGQRYGPDREQDQYVLVPAPVLDRLRDALTPEQLQPSPYVSVEPIMRSGEPVLHGTRLSAELIAERYWHLGEALDTEILEAYDLTRPDVIVCCWFVSRHGSRTWRKRWGDWANQVWAKTGEGTGWWSELYSDVPLPPTRAQALAERGEG